MFMLFAVDLRLTSPDDHKKAAMPTTKNKAAPNVNPGLERQGHAPVADSLPQTLCRGRTCGPVWQGLFHGQLHDGVGHGARWPPAKLRAQNAVTNHFPTVLRTGGLRQIGIRL